MTILQRYFDLTVELKDKLTALDEMSGDGDFGHNLEHGLRRAVEVFGAGAGNAGGIRPQWQALSQVFLDEIGGTSGPLFGLLFQSLLNATGANGSFEADFAGGLAEGLAAIQRVGEAKVGDRTLVDALAPAAEATQATDWTMDAVVQAAVDGAVATADIVARRGRSSYVGERALGHPDPGAVGMAMFFVALACEDRAAAQAEIDRLFASVQS